jgi:uncharacterized protein YecT (DUF1311 family)
MTKLLRPIAIAALVFCTAAAAEPEYWGEGSTEYAREYGDSVALCAQYRKVEPPAADRPTPAQLAALKDCDSSEAYYGIQGPRDLDRARSCAFAEMARGENDGPVGAGVLMMLYANGEVVKRNLPYAIRMACTVGGAPFEVDARIKALKARMAETGEPDTPFDYCDDITSGYASSQCAMIVSRRRDADRAARVADLGQAWTPAQKAAFKAVTDTERAYIDAMVQGEVDLSGTMRGVFAAEAEGQVKDYNLDLLESLASNTMTDPVDGAYAAEDARLNAVWKTLMAQSFEDAGTVTKGGVRATQRAWLKHRDAWAAFAISYRTLRKDQVLAEVTRERTRLLRCMLADDPDPDLVCGTPEENS